MRDGPDHPRVADPNATEWGWRLANAPAPPKSLPEPVPTSGDEAPDVVVEETFGPPPEPGDGDTVPNRTIGSFGVDRTLAARPTTASARPPGHPGDL